MLRVCSMHYHVVTGNISKSDSTGLQVLKLDCKEAVAGGEFTIPRGGESGRPTREHDCTLQKFL